MSAPLFDEEWLSKTQQQHDSALSKFQTAVTAALSGTDEGVKQVTYLIYGFWLNKSYLIEMLK
jgi:hypothetical protein